uniref:C2 domain-containing protein n=1 Tax=Oncorhynchus tshawytscha TaxID=74940 RepID=A0A8C8C896_ONCTS
MQMFAPPRRPKIATGGLGKNRSSAKIETPKPQGVDAVSVLWTFGKCLGALLPVYLAGYYRVSTSLLVFGLMVYTGWKHSREAKEARLRSAIHHNDNEQQYSDMKMLKSKKDLPAWVNFPDVEKVEWLNKILQQVWPFVGQYLEKLLVETIAPSIRASSTHLQTLTFTKVDFGDKYPSLLPCSYVGNVEINVEVKRYFCKAGVKGIQLHGMMRVILEPLIGDVPIVGAVTMFFIRRPKLDINWTGLTNLLDIPGLNIMSDTMIMDAIASHLVLPNRLTVPLVADLHVAQLRSPLPRGVVRIHLLEADDLPAKDNYIKGVIAGLSDPYALCRVGPQTFTSHVVDNTVCPKWGEMYEVIVHEVPGQELEVEVYDKDPDQDDFLGRTKIDLGIVKKSTVVDEWFTLKETKSGRVHFRLEWLVLLPNTEQLEQNLTVSSKTSDPPSAAILAVYLDKAEALPMKKGNKEPSPMVQLSVQDITRESRTCWTTINPEWEDAFTFFIPDPRKQSIDIQVKDNDRIQTLGTLSIPLSRLLSSPNLSLDQWFQLDKSGPASPGLAAGFSKIRPRQTSPDPSFATEGVLRIHLLEGQNLVPKDNMMGGMVKGKSDPYVKINIGGETFESRVINRNLNPTWNEIYETVMTPQAGQEVQLELYDKDMDKDDFLGSGKEPKAAAELALGKTTYRTKVCDRTHSPQWDEAFYFLVRDPKEEMLIVKVSGCLSVIASTLLSLAHLSFVIVRSHDGLQTRLPLTYSLSLNSLLKKGSIHVMISLLYIFNKFFILYLFLLLYHLTTLVFKAMDHVICCVFLYRDLESSSKDGLDTYISLMLLPDKTKATKKKTSVKKRDLNPEYNERFEFDLSVEEARRRRLSVTVKNSSASFRSSDIIGQVSLGLDYSIFFYVLCKWNLF